MIEPDFYAWSHANLVEFATEAYSRILEDTYEIELLKQDLRMAIQAYRQINTRSNHE
jgi:hypothetical protein